MLDADVFLDSSKLADLRTLFDGLAQSETIILIATTSVLHSPWWVHVSCACACLGTVVGGYARACVCACMCMPRHAHGAWAPVWAQARAPAWAAAWCMGMGMGRCLLELYEASQLGVPITVIAKPGWQPSAALAFLQDLEAALSAVNPEVPRLA